VTVTKFVVLEFLTNLYQSVCRYNRVLWWYDCVFVDVALVIVTIIIHSHLFS